MKKSAFLMAWAIALFSLVSLNAYADTIGAGVPDTEITARYNRDGASGISFIDLNSRVNGNGLITTWSIYAQKSIPLPGWSDNDDARQVGLMFFRDTGRGYTVVGKSPLETIPKGGWDQKYIFTDLGAGIPVQAGDYLGFYYPFQGADFGDYPSNRTPGGVIAFDFVPPSSGGHNVRWHDPWGSQQAALNVGDTEPYNWFNNGIQNGNGRIYSINASGTGNIVPIPSPVPVPSSVLLLGSGLATLISLRRRSKG